jgi:hypothetical protein
MTPTPLKPARRRARTLHMRVLATGFALLCAQGAVPAQAQPSYFEEDFDDPYKSWEEVAIQLPAAPQAENLLPFEPSGNASHSFAVDAKSISVGTDGVIRYTLVTLSSAGARNVSYEGMRCSSGEKKLYAFGQPDGSWSRSRRDRWEPIQGSAANRYHAVLAREYFCQEKTIAGEADKIVYRLRNNLSLAPNLGP